MEFTGFVGWLMWLVVHIQFLKGMRNRVVTNFTWMLNAINPRRYNLVTTQGQLTQRLALAKLDAAEEASQ